MRKFAFLQGLVLALFLINCDPKDSDDGGDGGSSPKTPEENKEAIQDIAVQFVGELSQLEATATVQAAISLGYALESDDDEDNRLASIARINKSILAFSKGKLSATGFAEQSSRLAEEEPVSLQELFDESKGVYGWNSTDEVWDTTSVGGDLLQFDFPAEDGGTTNNASLTLRSFTTVEMSNPLEEEVSDLPKSLLLDLTIDGTKEMEYSFTIDYNSNGEPENVQTDLFINPFNLAVTLTNTTTKAGSSVALTHGDVTVIGVSAEVTGDFSEDAIRSLDEEDGDENIPDVFKSAVFTYTMMNLELSGDIDVPNFYEAVKDLNLYVDACCGEDVSSEDKDEVDDAAPKLEAALNTHTTLTMKYVDSGATAADIEWEAGTEIDTYDEWTDYYVTIGANMVFADESKVDLEDYLTTGFDQLESEINKLIDQFGASTGEDFDHIDFDDIDFD